MLFASSIDAGLIPFFAFTSFVAYREFKDGVYNWGSLFNDAQITSDIVDALFIASAVCGGLHILSFVISIYLAIVMRQIAKLPPDMNPLEDNLTARPHKRSKSELKDKHLSSSTLDSAHSYTKSVLDDSPMDIPRTIPFSHTRQGSSVTDSSHITLNKKRASQTSLQSHRMSRTDLPSQQRRLYEESNQSTSSLTRSSAQRLRDSPSSRPGSLVLEDTPVLRPTSSRYVPTDLRWDNPAPSHDSENWITYPSPTSSPVNENVARQLSPIPSRNSSPQSMYSSVSDWLGPIPKFGRIESSPPQDGEYAVLQGHEYYGNDDHDDDVFVGKENVEQDLGDRSYNPLAMNPPTPQPKENELEKETARKPSLRRVALTDLPNPSVKEYHDMPEITSYNSANRFYGDLDGSSGGLSVPRATSNQVSSPPSKAERFKTFGSKRLWRRKSGKSSAYESVKAKEEEVDDEEDNAEDNESDDDDDNNSIPALTGKHRTTTAESNEGDRKGRIVSNSGIDLGTGFQLGVGSNSYGSYISGLGVGRRRDVSGKVAEEGRGGTSTNGMAEREEDTPDKKRGTGRAAGWARFAGL
jgi:hypothetical protein